MTIYFIDFENVHETGLKGIEDLPEGDAVHLFYTVNANKISWDAFDLCRRSNLYLHRVAAGKQSLDMMLSSFLGYQLAAFPEARFAVISKDHDFAPVVNFWNSGSDTEAPVMQASSIQGILNPAEAPLTEAVPEAAAAETPAEAADKPKTRRRRTSGRTGSRRRSTASAAPEATEAPAETADAPVKEEIPEAAPADKPEPAPKEAPAPKAAAPKAKVDITAVNNAIQKTLAAEKVDTVKISFLSSTTAKLYGKQGYKQAIYRAVIKQYGQKEGLQLYGLIKPCLK